MARSRYRGSVQNTGPRVADERSVQIQVLGGRVVALREALQFIYVVAIAAEDPEERLDAIRTLAMDTLQEDKNNQ